MNTISKIFTLAATLTLAAGCDAEPDYDLDSGADQELDERGGFGVRFNTSFLGDFEWNEIDLTGVLHDDAAVDRVCLSPGQYGKDTICLYPRKGDRLWVEESQIYGESQWMKGTVFSGADFVDSTWLLRLDYDKDGVLDSKIITKIEGASFDFTPAGIPFWSYFWTYYPSTGSGPIVKSLEGIDDGAPICEKDPDTGTLDTIVSRDLHVDTATGEFISRGNTMYIGCSSGAVGKVQLSWGYIFYVFGYERTEAMVGVARADYCKDGKSWTKPGQKLQIEEVWGINAFFDPGKETEAHWLVGGGAACLGTPRYAGVSYADVEAHCGIPKCEGTEPLGKYGDEVQTKLAI